MKNDTEKNVNTEENKTPLTIDTLSANTYQTNLKFTKSADSLIKPNHEVQKNLTDNPTINTKEEQRTEPIKLNFKELSRDLLIQHLERKTKQNVILEESLEDQKKAFNELKKNFEENQAAIKGRIELAEERGANTVKREWRHRIDSKDEKNKDIIIKQAKKYGLITPEEAEKLRQKNKNLEEQQIESFKLKNKNKNLENKVAELEKDLIDSEERRKGEEEMKWKLLNDYAELEGMFEDAKKLAREAGAEEAIGEWNKHVPKDEIIEVAEDEYGMISQEDKEELETKIKSLEAQIKQQTNSTEPENISGKGWTPAALEKVRDLQSQVDHLSHELTREKDKNELLETKIQNLESSNQREKDRHSKTKERINNLVSTTRNQVKEEYENFINPLDKGKVKTIAAKYGMKTPEEFDQIANEFQQLKDNNISANPQEQISEINTETKPITGKQINIALVFLTVVSWMGLLGVLIKDRKKPEQSKVRIK
jgi:hypothetical protein